MDLGGGDWGWTRIPLKVEARGIHVIFLKQRFGWNLLKTDLLSKKSEGAKLVRKKVQGDHFDMPDSSGGVFPQKNLI